MSQLKSSLSESSLLSLCYRTHFFRHFIHRPDIFAEKIVESFEQWPELFRTPVGKYNSLHLGRRSWLTEEILREKIAQYKNLTIVNLGCGLETLFQRLPQTGWTGINIDQEDVIRTREDLRLDESGIANLSMSILDLAWHTQIPIGGKVIFVIAGVIGYLPQDESEALLIMLSRLFPGSELIFDSCSLMGKWVTNASIFCHRQSAAYFSTSLSAHEIHRLIPGVRIEAADDLSDFTAIEGLDLPTRTMARCAQAIRLGTLWHLSWGKTK